MYKKIYIDKNMEQLITEDFKKILIDSSIPFDFIDELNIVDKGSTYPNIFKSDLYLEKFKSILNNLNAFDKEGKPIKRGFIAKANAIFEFEKRLEEKNFHKKIMMSNITIKEFVEFLNLEFNLGIKYHPNYKLSSGEKHETVVKRFY